MLKLDIEDYEELVEPSIKDAILQFFKIRALACSCGHNRILSADESGILGITVFVSKESITQATFVPTTKLVDIHVNRVPGKEYDVIFNEEAVSVLIINTLLGLYNDISPAHAITLAIKALCASRSDLPDKTQEQPEPTT